MTEREELARVLCEINGQDPDALPTNMRSGGGWCNWCERLTEADAILASPWLARVKAEARAEGLEQAAGIADNWTYDPQTGDDIAAAIRAAKETI